MRTLPQDSTAQEAVAREIQAFKKKTMEVKDHHDIYLSTIYNSQMLRGLWMITNLKEINQHTCRLSCMETLYSIPLLLTSRDWAVTLDLRDAYLHVPMRAKFHL